MGIRESVADGGMQRAGLRVRRICGVIAGETMTVQEKARKVADTIARLLNVSGYSRQDAENLDAVIQEIAAALQQAREEGFAQAREMAAKVVTKWEVCGPNGPRLHNGDLVIDAINAL